MPTIKILFFAAAADAFGAAKLEMSPDESASVGELLDRLAVSYPASHDVLGRSAVAVNERYAQRSTPIRPGDTIAIIPPVSGG